MCVFKWGKTFQVRSWPHLQIKFCYLKYFRGGRDLFWKHTLILTSPDIMEQLVGTTRFTARMGYNCPSIRPSVRPSNIYALSEVGRFGKQAFSSHVSCKCTFRCTKGHIHVVGQDTYKINNHKGERNSASPCKTRQLCIKHTRSWVRQYDFRSPHH